MYLPSLVNWFTTRDLEGWLSVIIFKKNSVHVFCAMKASLTNIVPAYIFLSYAVVTP